MEMSSSVQVPETLEEALSPDWLSAALGQRFPGIKVTSVTRGPIVSRVSTNARFRITCEDDLPARSLLSSASKGILPIAPSRPSQPISR